MIMTNHEDMNIFTNIYHLIYTHIAPVVSFSPALVADTVVGDDNQSRPGYYSKRLIDLTKLLN